VTDSADFCNRVRKNARHVGRWARRRNIECYRVYDRDIPEFAFALDVYGARAHLQEYERRTVVDDAQHVAWRQAIQLATAEALELTPRAVVLKRRRQRAGNEQHAATGRQGEDFAVQEGGHRFIVNLEAHLDTGLFLDHRITRGLVAEEARDKRFLNLFCYTGSFSVYAAAAGARDSISVDLSNTYLEWAQHNFRLNDIDPRRHVLVRADVMRWLEHAWRDGERFDLIVMDPPSLSRSKAMTHDLDVQRDHTYLIDSCARLLDSGGVLYFSSNLQRFRLADAAFEGWAAAEISHRTVPEDFRNRRIHRCWRAVKQ